MKKPGKALLRGILYIVCLAVLITVIVVSIGIVRRSVSAKPSDPSVPAGGISAAQARTAAPDDGLIRNPYSLRTVQSEINGVSYTTFEVYNILSAEKDLLFVCGRMFESATVQNITWDGSDGYDIVILFRDGSRTYYGFDNDGGWR